MTNELTKKQIAERNERLFAALQGVSDVLSEWPDSDWNQVSDIQAMVNQAQEIVSQLG